MDIPESTSSVITGTNPTATSSISPAPIRAWNLARLGIDGYCSTRERTSVARESDRILFFLLSLLDFTRWNKVLVSHTSLASEDSQTPVNVHYSKIPVGLNAMSLLLFSG